MEWPKNASFIFNWKLLLKSCCSFSLSLVRLARPSPAPTAPASSSPWGASTGSCARETTPSAWAPAPPSTWPPCWSTWPPRSWSWPATPPGTTRRPGSSPATCSWPSATTRSSTSCWPGSPWHREESCPTSRYAGRILLIESNIDIVIHLLLQAVLLPKKSGDAKAGKKGASQEY